MTAPIRWVEQTTSTNADLARLAAEGAPHGATLVADQQTGGRGRLQRRWEARAGDAVLMSVLIRTPLPAARVPLLTLGAAVAVVEGIEQTCGLQTQIKWPNDVLGPQGGKLAGILAEAEFVSSRLSHAVIGVGLNVHGVPAVDGAACLADLAPEQALDRAAIAEAIRARLLHWVGCIGADPSGLLDRWRERSATIGARVRIGSVVGTAERIDGSGALWVRTEEGGLQRVLAGDVHRID